MKKLPWLAMTSGFLSSLCRLALSGLFCAKEDMEPITIRRRMDLQCSAFMGLFRFLEDELGVCTHANRDRHRLIAFIFGGRRPGLCDIVNTFTAAFSILHGLHEIADVVDKFAEIGSSRRGGEVAVDDGL